jgi:hypothetical protein
MATTARARSAFAWSAGAWWGTTIGCTLWLLILGGVLLFRDAFAGGVCIASFAALNAWGVLLWWARGRLSAYRGLQCFFAALSLVVLFVALFLHIEEVSNVSAVDVSVLQPDAAIPEDVSTPYPSTPAGLFSPYVPSWTIVIGPALMLFCNLREQWFLHRDE